MRRLTNALRVALVALLAALVLVSGLGLALLKKRAY